MLCGVSIRGKQGHSEKERTPKTKKKQRNLEMTSTLPLEPPHAQKCGGGRRDRHERLNCELLARRRRKGDFGRRRRVAAALGEAAAARTARRRDRLRHKGGAVAGDCLRTAA